MIDPIKLTKLPNSPVSISSDNSFSMVSCASKAHSCVFNGSHSATGMGIVQSTREANATGLSPTTKVCSPLANIVGTLSSLVLTKSCAV